MASTSTGGTVSVHAAREAASYAASMSMAAERIMPALGRLGMGMSMGVSKGMDKLQEWNLVSPKKRTELVAAAAARAAQAGWGGVGAGD